MQEAGRRNAVDGTGDTRLLRRILVTTGLVLVVLILIVVAIYAGAYLILAPMMA